MSQSLAQILVHIIFSTKNRQRFITPSIQPEVNAFISAEARKNGSPAARVESVEDHVHLIVSLSRTNTVSSLIEKLKTSSSRWLKTKGAEFSEFQWQRGYGAFSISKSALGELYDYFDSQQERHRRKTFQEELREFLDEYGVKYDERYVWD